MFITLPGRLAPFALDADQESRRVHQDDDRDVERVAQHEEGEALSHESTSIAPALNIGLVARMPTVCPLMRASAVKAVRRESVLQREQATRVDDRRGRPCACRTPWLRSSGTRLSRLAAPSSERWPVPAARRRFVVVAGQVGQELLDQVDRFLVACRRRSRPCRSPRPASASRRAPRVDLLPDRDRRHASGSRSRAARPCASRRSPTDCSEPAGGAEAPARAPPTT